MLPIVSSKKAKVINKILFFREFLRHSNYMPRRKFFTSHIRHFSDDETQVRQLRAPARKDFPLMDFFPAS